MTVVGGWVGPRLSHVTLSCSNRPPPHPPPPPPHPPNSLGGLIDWLIGRLPKHTAQNGRFSVCASPMRKPYAKALCTRVLLNDIYKEFLSSPPCRHIPEEDPGAQGFRTELAHTAGAYPEAAILSSGFGRRPINQSINPPHPAPHPPNSLGWGGVGTGIVPPPPRPPTFPITE